MVSQFELRSKKSRDSEIDGRAIADHLEGRNSLKEALHVSERTVESLRDKAQALYETGKWQPCIDILLGLSALDCVALEDTVMLTGCYEGLGDTEKAEACRVVRDRILSAVDAALGEDER